MRPRAIEHLDEVEPERLGEEQERADEERELKPVVGIVHGRSRSEFFRTKHGHDEVDEAAEGDEADDDGFHGENRIVERLGSFSAPCRRNQT